MPDSSLHTRIRSCQQFFSSQLFQDVQLSGVFADSKTFADVIPKKDYQAAMEAYPEGGIQDKVQLEQFVLSHFDLPHTPELEVQQQQTSVAEYIQSLWPLLCRSADKEEQGSLLPLHFPYIVPGGRFREIYYWDSYFTALGLKGRGYDELAVNMLQNFLQLTQSLGHVPNGNRSYYATRSQPPILALMVQMLLGDELQHLDAFTAARSCDNNEDTLQRCVAGMQAEYDFWMQGQDQLSQDNPRHRRVVRLSDGSILNRYWDDDPSPRVESYKEDIEAAQQLPPEQRGEYYRHIRAACESGWDFSSRWLADPQSLLSIQTTHIVPVDLNALLFHLEGFLARCYQFLGKVDLQEKMQNLAEKRRQSLIKHCWVKEKGFLFDLNLEGERPTPVYSLAAAVPLYTQMVTPEMAQLVGDKIGQEFLRAGGLVTTLNTSHEQWDSPNGWAPLQWFAAKGVAQYGMTTLSTKIKRGWLNTVQQCFAEQQCLMEKYNVENPLHQAVGGEYQVQHGFGWTNGVTDAFLQDLK